MAFPDPHNPYEPPPPKESKSNYRVRLECYNCKREFVSKEIPLGQPVMKEALQGLATKETCPHCGCNDAAREHLAARANTHKVVTW